MTSETMVLIKFSRRSSPEILRTFQSDDDSPAPDKYDVGVASQPPLMRPRPDTGGQVGGRTEALALH
jgi:hypothetical protein